MAKYLDKDDLQFALAFQAKRISPKISNFTSDVIFFLKNEDTSVYKDLANYNSKVIFSYPENFFQNRSNLNHYWDKFPEIFDNRISIGQGAVFLAYSLENVSNPLVKGSQFFNYLFNKYPEEKENICKEIVDYNWDKFSNKIALSLLLTVPYQFKNLKNNKDTAAPQWLKDITHKMAECAKAETHTQVIKFEALNTSTWKALNSFTPEDSKLIMDNLMIATNGSLKLKKLLLDSTPSSKDETKLPPKFSLTENNKLELEIVKELNFDYSESLLVLETEKEFNVNRLSNYIKDYVQAYTQKYEQSIKDEYRGKINYDTSFRSVKDGMFFLKHTANIKLSEIDNLSKEQEMKNLANSIIQKVTENSKQHLQDFLDLIYTPGASQIVNNHFSEGASFVTSKLKENHHAFNLQKALNENMEKRIIPTEHESENSSHQFKL